MAELMQVAPLPALLTIYGETWIPETKVRTAQTFRAMKKLHTWLAQLWSIPDSQSAPVKRSLKLSVEILRQALADEQNCIPLELGTDLGIYCAALVLWAITITMNERAERSQQTSHTHRLSAPPIVYDATLLSYAQITNNTLAFLSIVWPGGHHDMDPARYQMGCVNLLIWVEYRLRGVPLEDQSSAADIRVSQPREGLGELLWCLTHTIERLVSRIR